jgi:hypothetical protein
MCVFKFVSDVRAKDTRPTLYVQAEGRLMMVTKRPFKSSRRERPLSLAVEPVCSLRRLEHRLARLRAPAVTRAEYEQCENRLLNSETLIELDGERRASSVIAGDEG